MTAPKHLDLLDRARGVAILLVLLCHTASCVYGYEFIPWDGWFRNFLDAPAICLAMFPLSLGGVGVAVFFVISGFCIHLSFQQQRKKWGNFFVRRFFRIYPAYLAALIFFVLLNPIGDNARGLGTSPISNLIWQHLALVENFRPATITLINPSFWSLAVEVQLYLLYPVLLFLVARFGWRGIMIALAATELLVNAANGWIALMEPNGSAAGTFFGLLAASPIGYWFSWAVGAYIAQAYMNGERLPFSDLAPIWWFTLAVVANLIRPLNPFIFTSAAFVSAVMISRFLSGTSRGITFSKFGLESLKRVGIWSYSIYLLNQPLQEIYFYCIHWLLPPGIRTPLAAVLLAFGSWLPIIALAWLWYQGCELPGIALGKIISRKIETGHESHAAASPKKLRGGRTTLVVIVLAVLVATTFVARQKLFLKDPEKGNNLAWALATNPDSSKRNGTLATKYAEYACWQTQYTNTVVVGTLAAAYAEAGRFDDAIATAQTACTLAVKSGEQTLLQQNQDLLALYLKHEAYHAPATNSVPVK